MLKLKKFGQRTMTSSHKGQNDNQSKVKKLLYTAIKNPYLQYIH